MLSKNVQFGPSNFTLERGLRFAIINLSFIFETYRTPLKTHLEVHSYKINKVKVPVNNKQLESIKSCMKNAYTHIVDFNVYLAMFYLQIERKE